VVLPSSN